MINIIDTYPQIHSLFENGTFCKTKWEAYINSMYTDCAHVFTDDLKECLESVYREYIVFVESNRV